MSICSNMDAWLKTHVAEISPTANALYMAGVDAGRLAHTRDALVLMLRAIREGYRVLGAHGIPITPEEPQDLPMASLAAAPGAHEKNGRERRDEHQDRSRPRSTQ